MIADWLERRCWDLHVLGVIHGEVASIAIASAERRYAQNIGNELELAAVPGPDHGARAGEALRFLINMRLVCGLPDFVLDQPVGPRGANDIHGRMLSGVEKKRHAVVKLAAVESAGFDLDQGILRQLETSHALELNPDPVMIR